MEMERVGVEHVDREKTKNWVWPKLLLLLFALVQTVSLTNLNQTLKLSLARSRALKTAHLRNLLGLKSETTNQRPSKDSSYLSIYLYCLGAFSPQWQKKAFILLSVNKLYLRVCSCSAKAKQLSSFSAWIDPWSISGLFSLFAENKQSRVRRDEKEDSGLNPSVLKH